MKHLSAGNQTIVKGCYSVCVYRNHQNADIQRYDFQVLVSLIYHSNPEKNLH